MNRYHIERTSTCNKSCKLSDFHIVKKSHYVLDTTATLTGDAPKSFVRIYKYHQTESVHKKNPKTWVAYIAKTGHKWYPNESVTELLLNKLGEIFGLNMAESELAVINGQLRFLSRYFLKSGYALIHGAEIFAGYLSDEKFVNEVEEQGLSRDIFTLQFVESSVSAMFPKHKDYIMHELIRLLLYDALVGNNDRHYFNWGVVKKIGNENDLIFAPVYDTARGLFWNDDDEKVLKRTQDVKQKLQYIEKYCRNSRPKLGWDGDDNLNHFSMVEHIVKNEFYIEKEEISRIFQPQLLERMYQVVDGQFGKWFIPERTDLIKYCLNYRFHKINEIIWD